MNLELTGRHVLVTGGSRGIGLACVRAFLREGAKLSLAARRREGVDAAVGALRAEGFEVAGFDADLTDPQAAERMLDAAERQGGPVQVLVNSAGAARRTPFAELTAQHWRDAMDAKFFSYIFPTDIVVKRMAARGRGAIVNIIGMGGKVAQGPHLAGGSANAALMLATAGLAAVYGPQGVRVNGINPGGTLTGRVQEGLNVESRMTGVATEELLARAQAKVPLQRLATPEEIAKVALFLASDDASYVTGALIPMDGGAASVI